MILRIFIFKADGEDAIGILFWFRTIFPVGKKSDTYFHPSLSV
jgi:hypothetical protein